MRIRTKIAALYTQLTFMVLAGSFAFIYFISAKIVHSDFYDEIWNRAMIIAQVRYEKDEMTKPAYDNLLERSKFMLNGERISIFSINDKNIVDSLRKIVHSESDIKDLLNGKTIEFKRDERFNIGLYYPDNEDNVVVLASAIDNTRTENLHDFLRLLIIILISSTVLVYFIGLLYARKVLSPIMSIINKVKSITANNLSESLKKESGNDELSELSRTFNNMIIRLRHSFDMQNSFIRNASHELRNPLTAILGEAEIALSKPRTEKEYVATLETVLVESERLNLMIKDLLMLAQTDFDFSRIPKKHVNVICLIKDITKTIAKTEMNFLINDKDNYMTIGVYSLLYIAFLNILNNASKFSGGKPVDITFSYKLGKVIISIKDKGIGIPQDEIKNVFQPFYRAQNTTSYKGTGIGLALAHRIIFLHKGKLSISSKTNEGTVVSVILHDMTY